VPPLHRGGARLRVGRAWQFGPMARSQRLQFGRDVRFVIDSGIRSAQPGASQ